MGRDLRTRQSRTLTPFQRNMSSIPAAPTYSPCPTPQEPTTPEDDKWATGALLIYVSLLFVILLTSYYLQSKKLRIPIHETVVSIFLGLIVGLIVRLTPWEGLSMMITFDHRYFFNLLLPPIILNSGYDMKRKNFFRNIGSILTFALVGTVISTIIIGVLVFLVVRFLVITHVHPELQLSMLDCIVFGSVLSSTDPVTILAIFHQMRVDPKLYAIIFGESILNDSVAIVLFKVLGQFRGKEITPGNLVHGVASFLAVFMGSVMVGIIIALICALMLKHSRLHDFPSLESSIIVLLAYSSYLLSNAVQLSGIVSLLFCGICLKHYAYANMSVRTRRTTKYMFRVLSQLSENFVFIYLGVTVFTNTRNEVYRPALIFFTLLICLVARYMSVIPLARLINIVSRRVHGNGGEEIPRNHQLMLWWAGLRGAIAFALSFEVTGDTAKVVQTTTLIICIITVILLGGTTNIALERLGIRTGVGGKSTDVNSPDGNMFGVDGHEERETDSSDDDSEDEADGFSSEANRGNRSHDWNSEWGRNRPSRRSGSNNMEPMETGRVQINVEEDSGSLSDDDMAHWFMSFDTRWIKPLFTRTRWKWGRKGGRRAHESPARERLLVEGEESKAGRVRAFGRPRILSDGQRAEGTNSRSNRMDDREEAFQDVNGNVWRTGSSSRPV